MDAIELIKADHEKLRSLLDRAEKAKSEDSREDLLDALRAELKPHERMEEQIFYPALEKFKEAKEIVLEGVEEHHVADLIMEELSSTPIGSDVWTAKLKVLKENIEHHLEEEEGEMFDDARKLLDKQQLEALGERMAAFKQAS